MVRKTRQPRRKAGRFSVPSIPPSIVTRPWFNLVVRMDVTSSNTTTPVTIMASDVGTALATQLFGQNPPTVASMPLQVRFQSVKIWGYIPNLSTATMQPLTAVIMDLFGLSVTGSTVTSPRALDQITRYPDAVRRASIGYLYPEAQSNLSVDVRGGPQALAVPLLSILGAGPTPAQNAVVYWNLMWRSGTITAGQ